MDWNAGKAARHRAAIEAILCAMQSWEDGKKAELAAQFPGWDIWYVRHAGQLRNTWCARPKGAPVATFHAFGPVELAGKIERAEGEVGKP